MLLQAVQQVLHNMRVSHIEIRSEDSVDIKQYAHERKVEKVVVPLGEELKSIRDLYMQVSTEYCIDKCDPSHRNRPVVSKGHLYYNNMRRK